MPEFQTESELEEFLQPVLQMRVQELSSYGLSISEHELFTYLKKRCWKNKKNLHLCEIVQHILNEPIEK